MAITELRRRQLEGAIVRLRELAKQERSRTRAAERDHQYSSTALKNAEAHERQAATLQAELDGAGA